MNENSGDLDAQYSADYPLNSYSILLSAGRGPLATWESPSAWRHRICEATPDTSCRMYSESTEIVLYKLATMLLDIDI